MKTFIESSRNDWAWNWKKKLRRLGECSCVPYRLIWIATGILCTVGDGSLPHLWLLSVSLLTAEKKEAVAKATKHKSISPQNMERGKLRPWLPSVSPLTTEREKLWLRPPCVSPLTTEREAHPLTTEREKLRLWLLSVGPLTTEREALAKATMRQSADYRERSSGYGYQMSVRWLQREKLRLWLLSVSPLTTEREKLKERQSSEYRER